MILGFAHPALVVPDLAAAIRFYTQMFGFVSLSEANWNNAPDVDAAIGLHASAADSVMLKGHNCYLELFQYHAPQATGAAPTPRASDQGLRHLAFFVTDLAAEYERLIALGGQRLGVPLANEQGRLAVYARDPFGNLIELCEPPDATETLTNLPGIRRESTFEG